MSGPSRNPAVAAAWLAGLAAAEHLATAPAILPPVRRLLGGAVLSRVATERPLVALTFDDGPDPMFTPRFLEVLGATPATFFVIGRRAERHAGIVAEAVSAGHEIACHGDTHRSLATLGPRATASALERARDAVHAASGAPPRFFRPAHGVFNRSAWAVAPRLGMRRTLWTAWARDWEAHATPGRTAGRILRAARPGAILLLHDADGRREAPGRTLVALPRILEGLRARNLRPVTLSTLVAAAQPDG